MIFALISSCVLYLAGGIVMALSTNGEINNWWVLAGFGLTLLGFAVMWSSLRSVVM